MRSFKMPVSWTTLMLQVRVCPTWLWQALLTALSRSSGIWVWRLHSPYNNVDMKVRTLFFSPKKTNMLPCIHFFQSRKYASTLAYNSEFEKNDFNFDQSIQVHSIKQLESSVDIKWSDGLKRYFINWLYEYLRCKIYLYFYCK